MNNEIDLHGEDRKSAIIKLDEFLNDMIFLKEPNVRIIHGVGEGILRKTVLNYLHNDQRVLEYRIDFYNAGMTNVTSEKE